MKMNKTIFLDKDGVINEHVYETDGKIMSPTTMEQTKILPNVKQGIQNLKEQGFKIIVITNQPGIAFGYLRLEKLKEINEFLKKEFEIDEIYFCPHHPKITGECECRKPKIGMILQAAKDFNLDLENSYTVGDSLSDIETGKNAKTKKNFLIGVARKDILDLQHQKNIFPDYTLPDLIEVAKKIKEIEEKL